MTSMNQNWFHTLSGVSTADFGQVYVGWAIDILHD